MAVEHLSTEELLSIKNANGNFSHLPTDTLQRFAHPSGQPYVQHSFDEGIVPETPFETAANVGKFVVGGINQAAGGQPLGPLHNAAVGSIPQTPTAAALSPLMAMGGPEEAANSALSTGAERATKVIKPGPAAKLAGEAASVTTRVPSRFTSAWFADPTILSEETPSVQEVVNKMGQYFKEKGVNINSQELQKLSGKGYIPNDNQVEQLRSTMLQPVLDKIEAVANKVPGATAPTEEELIFAERAANAMTRSTGAQQNRYLMSFASGARNSIMDQLEKAGFGKLPELKAQYFRALAKEAAQDFLPQNKTGGPNALSALLMGHALKSGLGHLAAGDIPAAIGSGLQGAAFSPYMVGGAIKGASNIPNLQQPASVGLQRLFNQPNAEPKAP